MHYKKHSPAVNFRYMLAVLVAQMPWVCPLFAQDLDPSLWHLNRSSALEDQPFRMQVLSNRYSCAHAFTAHNVQVTPGRLDLSFAAEAQPGMACPAILDRRGPVFSVPALAPGAYRVFLHPQLPCHRTQAPVCTGPIPEEDAGTLLVAGEDGLAYVLDPTQVLSGGTFSLKLYMPEFTCGDVQFLRLSSRREGGKVIVTFLPKGGERVCRGQPQLYGPAFSLEGLPTGAYEIWAERLPPCAEQGCELAPVTRLAGYLSVKTKAGATRAGSGNAASSSSRGWAAWREGGLALRLPDGAEGIWRVEVLSLSGRRLHRAYLKAGGTGLLRGIRPAERGLVLVRLAPPGHDTYTLRVAKE